MDAFQTSAECIAIDEYKRKLPNLSYLVYGSLIAWGKAEKTV